MNPIASTNQRNISTLYSARCPSISGRSTLDYAIGRDDADQTLHLSILHNSGKGMWCRDWVPTHAVQAIVVSNGLLTAKSFQRLHPGKSINTGGFVLAALRDLGVIRPAEGNSRVHEQAEGMTVENALAARLAGDEGAAPAGRAHKDRRKAKEAI